MKLEGKVSITLNTGALNRQAGRILGQYARELDPILDRQFTDEKWNWPRRTLRQNGKWAETTRDIIDTGELQRSKQGPKAGPPPAKPNNYYGWTGKSKPSGVRRWWVWDTPYADAVKNGTGNGHLPRDWVKAALEELPFRPYVIKALSRLRTRKKR